MYELKSFSVRQVRTYIHSREFLFRELWAMRIHLPNFHEVEPASCDNIFGTYEHIVVHSLTEFTIARLMIIECSSEDPWEQEKENACPYEKGSVEELFYLRGVPFPSRTTSLPLDEVSVHREEMGSGETPAVQPVVIGTPILPNIMFVTRTHYEHTRADVDITCTLNVKPRDWIIPAREAKVQIVTNLGSILTAQPR